MNTCIGFKGCCGMCMWCARQTYGVGGSHTHLLRATTIDGVHKGTNRKALQSCGGSTSWGVSSTPGLSSNTWARVLEHTWRNNTQMNVPNTVEGSRLQSQGHTWCIATYAHFKRSPLSVAPFIPKGHVTCCTCTGDDIINDVIMSWNDITSWRCKISVTRA